MYINQLTEELIQEINLFLVKNGKAYFSTQALTLLDQLVQPHNDTLNIIENAAIGLRGEIDSISEDSQYFDAIVSSSLDANGAQIAYSIAQLPLVDIGELQAKVPRHYLFLNTSGRSGVFDLVFLNSEYHPIALGSLNLEHL